MHSIENQRMQNIYNNQVAKCSVNAEKSHTSHSLEWPVVREKIGEQRSQEWDLGCVKNITCRRVVNREEKM